MNPLGSPHPMHASAHPHELPAHFADYLDLEAALTAPVRDAALDGAAAALAENPSSVADLGAGTGTGSIALARRFPGAVVHSLDVSEELLDRLRSTAAAAGLADRIDVHWADLEGPWAAALPSGLDLAWASMSLHHVADPSAVLRQTFEALRPGGVLVVTEMTGGPRYEPMDLGSGRDGLHERLLSALSAIGYPPVADWTRALAAAGFEAVRRFDADALASADTPEGSRYLTMQVASWRDLLGDRLSADDLAGLQTVLDALETGSSALTSTSGRAVWVAIRPAAPAAGESPAASDVTADDRS